MLSRHNKTSQVKCNFCLQWMSLSSELKFNINVCDQCLYRGCEQKALQAVTSSGEIYRISIVNPKFTPDISICEKAIQTSSQQKNPLENLIHQPQMIEQTELIKDFDKFKDDQIQEIKAKWNIISSFINQKDFFSTEEIGYLQILISQNPHNLNKNQQNFSLIPTSPRSMHKSTSEFDNQQNKLQISSLKQNSIYESVSNFNNVQINIKIANKQNDKIPTKKSIKHNQNTSTRKDQSTLKIPCKTALKQKDLNRNYGSYRKQHELKQCNYTETKRINTQFFDLAVIPVSSRVSSSTLVAQTSPKSAFGSSCFNSITKRLNTEEITKFEQIKNKILKYLQKNYDSQPLARLMFSIVFEAYQSTTIIGKSIELVSYNLSYTDFRCYLQSLDWTGIQVLKLVNTKLSDDQLKTLIDFIITNHLPIKVLVLTSNKLTENSIEHLASHELPFVKQIYLGKNHITKGKVRAQTFALQNKYSLYM